MAGCRIGRLGFLIGLLVCGLLLGLGPIGAEESVNQAPTARFGSITPFPATAGSDLSFNGWGSDPDGYIVVYQWDFDGDGFYDWNSTFNGTTAHKYAKPGIYQLNFRVKDNNNTWSEAATSTLQVFPAPGDDGEVAEGGFPLLVPLLAAGALVLLALGGVARAKLKPVQPESQKESAARRKSKAAACPVCTVIAKPGDELCRACGAPLDKPGRVLAPPPRPAKARVKAAPKKTREPRRLLARRRKQARAAKGVKVDETGQKGTSPFLVEEVFLISHDGRVMAHMGQVDSGTDYELVGGMFSAVMDFVKDSFGRPGYLGAIEYGDNRILIEMGQHSFLAVVVFGEPSRALKEQVQDVVPRVETYLSGAIENWDGDRALMEPAREFLAPLVMQTAGVTRQQVREALAEEGVKLVSAWEYYQGCVRLKVACVNHTPTVITDVKVDVDYDKQLLRWDHMEPEYEKDGSRVHLGIIEGGGKKTVAVAFDPLMCQKTSLNALASYKDAQSELHTVKMKRRVVEVVCPLFFTPENASTATLRRLIDDKLECQDSKVYLLPERMKPARAFELAKQTLEGRDVKFVKQYIQPEPYKAEAWYYGVTKVKQEEVVVRVGVDEEAGLVSLFAASAQAHSLAGLLAELGHDMAKLAARRGVKLKAETDRLVKEEILAASYLMEELEAEAAKAAVAASAEEAGGREAAEANGQPTSTPALPEAEPEPTDIILPEKGKGRQNGLEWKRILELERLEGQAEDTPSDGEDSGEVEEVNKRGK